MLQYHLPPALLPTPSLLGKINLFKTWTAHCRLVQRWFFCSYLGDTFPAPSPPLNCYQQLLGLPFLSVWKASSTCLGRTHSSWLFLIRQRDAVWDAPCRKTEVHRNRCPTDVSGHDKQGETPVDLQEEGHCKTCSLACHSVLGETKHESRKRRWLDTNEDGQTARRAGMCEDIQTASWYNGQFQIHTKVSARRSCRNEKQLHSCLGSRRTDSCLPRNHPGSISHNARGPSSEEFEKGTASIRAFWKTSLLFHPTLAMGHSSTHAVQQRFDFPELEDRGSWGSGRNADSCSNQDCPVCRCGVYVWRNTVWRQLIAIAHGCPAHAATKWRQPLPMQSISMFFCNTGPHDLIRAFECERSVPFSFFALVFVVLSHVSFSSLSSFSADERIHFAVAYVLDLSNSSRSAAPIRTVFTWIHMIHRPGPKVWSLAFPWLNGSTHRHLLIVHSKKTEPWGVFDFFQMFSKIFQFSLFQCLKDAFVLLTFQFQVDSTLGKQLSFFRAKISGLPFHPQAIVRCRCASYIYHSHVRRAKASRRWLCTATALVRCAYAERTTAKTPICAGTKEDSWTFFFFFFCQSRRSLLKALLLCLFGGERQGSVVRPFPASSPLSIVKIDVSEISKPPTRLPHPEKMTAMKPENAQEQERSSLSGHTQRCSDGSGWEQHPVPKFLNRTIVLAPNVVVFFLDQYANTLLGSCNGLRSYQPTSCGCQGSVFLEWTIS